MRNRALRIVIAGGTGQVGLILARHFYHQGHEVVVLSRHALAVPWRTIVWDTDPTSPWAGALDGADLVINLAGRSVNCRYDERNRREILLSRTETTAAIGEAIARCANPPRNWFNASTATIYRHTFDEANDEDTGVIDGEEAGAPSTWRFSIDVAKRWEQAFFDAETPRTRKVALRSAMIMSPDRGGVFDTLLALVRFGLGGTAGSGRQYASWVHDEDFVRAIEVLMEREDLEGVVNVCSPHPLPNREFMGVLRWAWRTPIGLPAARWILEIGAFFLRTETELILKSRRVVPGRLLDAEFSFEFPEWREAAQDLVRRWRK